jgi:hypothetical protein
MNYAILNADGSCINRILWDGESDWQPPVGCSAVADPDNLYPIEMPEETNNEMA